MMNRLFKILPILAIVVGIGGAWANQADESPCTAPLTPGYEKVNPADPDPTIPPTEPGSTMVSIGLLGPGFNCSQETQQKCFWAYAPGHPEAENDWIECDGRRLPGSN